MTPEQQKKYYADNKADAKKKEEKKDYEVFGSRGDAARKGMEEGKSNPMGDTYKKGGKVMKKMKRYNGEDGSAVETETAQGPNAAIDKLEGIRERAMKAVAEGGQKDEAASVPKKAAAKLTPKSEEPAPKTSSLPRGQQKVADAASSFMEKSKAQIGQAAKDQEASYKATQAKMKESGEGLSPRMKAARGITKAPSKSSSSGSTDYSVGNAMRSGGKVSSVSKRADGIATKGKTRGKMC